MSIIHACTCQRKKNGGGEDYIVKHEIERRSSQVVINGTIDKVNGYLEAKIFHQIVCSQNSYSIFVMGLNIQGISYSLLRWEREMTRRIRTASRDLLHFRVTPVVLSL